MTKQLPAVLPTPTGANAGGLSVFAATSNVLEQFFRNLNPKTVAAYASDLETFRAWCGAASAQQAIEQFVKLPAGQANAVANNWRTDLEKAELAPATINRRLAALRSIVVLQHRLGNITWTLDVPNIKHRTYRDTRGPGADAFRKIVENLSAQGDARSKRDLAITRLLFACALRREEVVTLDLKHYDRNQSRLHILGKKRAEREWVMVPPNTRIALDAWIAVRGEEPGPLFTSLARNGRNGRLTGRSIARNVVKRAGVDAGVMQAVRPHGLRHSGITTYLDASNGDVRKARLFSRHAKLETLILYDDALKDTAGEAAAVVDGVA